MPAWSTMPVRNSTLEMCPSPIARTVMTKRVVPGGQAALVRVRHHRRVEQGRSLDGELRREVGTDEPTSVRLQAPDPHEPMLHGHEVGVPRDLEIPVPVSEGVPYGLELRVHLSLLEVEDAAEDHRGTGLPGLPQLLAGQEDPADHAVVIGSQHVLRPAHPRQRGGARHRLTASSGIAATWAVESQASVDSAPWFTLT